MQILIFVALLVGMFGNFGCIGAESRPDLISAYEAAAAGQAVDVYVENKDILSDIPSTHEIVYPVQMRTNEQMSSLDTRDLKSKTKNAHVQHANFEMVISGRKHKVKLDLSRELLSGGLKQKRSSDSNSVEYLYDETMENCYYQGQIRKFVDSLVAVSTCKGGIKGVIILPAAVYFILPLRPRQVANETRYPHVVYSTSPDEAASCGNNRGMWHSYQALHFAEFLRNMKIMKLQEDDVFGEDKFLRLGLVADHALYERLNNSLSDTLGYLVYVANIVDALLKKMKLRIHLVYAELWNDHDLADVSRNVRTSLTTFLRYRLTMITTQKTGVKLDFAHLLSGQKFDNDEFGMAVQDSVCTDRALAVSQVTSVHDPLRVAAGITHLMGHALGIGHDATEECVCSDSRGCIMKQGPTGFWPIHARSWSTCSNKNIRQSILSQLDRCLRDSTASISFEQKCGNGITERGEECDCQNEECDLTDPCCDPSTCLLRSWATCRFGDCCHNCTVRPSNQICRDASGECDVPEFCDGTSGNCPSNALIQDGQLCRQNDGYCYRGVCHTYTDRCQRIWGHEASAADDQCFEMFNTAGRFDGHCGKNATNGEYLKCFKQNIKCGLLHCAKGTERPLLGHNLTFSLTQIVSHGNHYQCKVIMTDYANNSSSSSSLLPSLDPSSSLAVAMVPDGTKCGAESICVNMECVLVTRVMPVTCPMGENGKLCSGRGICTTDVRCFCSTGYTGPTCNERRNVTYFSLTTTLGAPQRTTPVSATKPPTTNISDKSVYSTSSALPVFPVAGSGKKKDASATLWLIIVLGVVVGSACVLLLLCIVCYRRKNPRKKIPMKSIGRSSCGGSVNSFSYNKSNDFNCDLATNRIISFGKTPSYRADKQRKARLDAGVTPCETDSEQSRGGDRSSTEVKVVSSPLPLAKTPEKGILKKYGHRMAASGMEQRLRKHSDIIRGADETGRRARKRSDGVREKEEGKRGEPVGGREREPLVVNVENEMQQSSIESPDPNGNKCSQNESLIPRASEVDNIAVDRNRPEFDVVNKDEDDSRSSSCSCEEDDEDDGDAEDMGLVVQKPIQSGGSVALDGTRGSGKGLAAVDGEPGNDQQTQTEPDRLENEDAEKDDEDTANKKVFLSQLQNQMGQQFDAVLRQTRRPPAVQQRESADMSPSNSEDFPCSETEADRSLPRNSFYRQGDFEPRGKYGDLHRPMPAHPGSGVGFGKVSQPDASYNRASQLGQLDTGLAKVSDTEPTDKPTDKREQSAVVSSIKPDEKVPNSPSNSTKLLRKKFFEITSSPPAAVILQPMHAWPRPVQRISPIPQSGNVNAASQRLIASVWPAHDSTRRIPCASTISGGPPSMRTQNTSPSFVSNREDDNQICGPSFIVGANTASTAAAVPYRGGTKALSVSPKPKKQNKIGSFSSGSGVSLIPRLSPARTFGSEGYGSDHGANTSEEAIVPRETSPRHKPTELRFVPDERGAYTKAPGSPGSPDDIDV